MAFTTSPLSAFGLAVVLFGVSACTVPAEGTKASPATADKSGAAESGDGSGGGPTDPIPPSGSTCSEMVTCTQSCSEEDAACVDACVAKGSESAKQKYEALSICLHGTVCNGDVACMEEQCKYHIDACKADVAPTYEPPLAPGSGSVPPEFVGAWYSQSGSYVFNFKADGTYTETDAAATPGGSGCTGSTVFSYEGIVQFKESTVTLSQTNASKTTKTCSFTTTTKPTPTTEVKSWFLDGNQLFICEKGATMESCAIALTKS
jgi:hypothetical protein